MAKRISDTENKLLSRRELVFEFDGAAGRLKKTEAADEVTRELGLERSTVIPVSLKNHVGRTSTTGIFYVYDDEAAARKHLAPAVFARLEKRREADKAAGAAGDGDAEKPDGEVEKPDGDAEKPDGEVEKPDGDASKAADAAKDGDAKPEGEADKAAGAAKDADAAKPEGGADKAAGGSGEGQ